MTTKNIGKEGVRWFVGKVEDINDPEMLGRVKLRVLNEHTETKISVDDLHWATPLLPTTSASFRQVGRSPTGLLVGSLVFGWFLDGNEKQMPIIWGSYAKLPGKDQANNDVPALARETNTIDKPLDGPEPKSAYAAKYPYNHVWQTLAGHVIEVDDTASHDRLHVYHRSGTYTEINTDGRYVKKVMDNDVEIVIKDKDVYIKGDVRIHVLGNVNITVDGHVKAKAADWDITGDVALHGKLTADGDVIGNNISLDNHTHTDPQGGSTG